MVLVTHAGGRESNAYASVSYADAYLVEYYGADNLGSWEDLTASMKGERLATGAAVIGMFPLRGYKAYIGQNLDFPRIIPGDSRFDGRLVPQAIIDCSVLIAFDFVHRAMQAHSSPDEGVPAGRVSEVSLGGLLDVKFADKPLTGGTLLSALIRSMDFAIIQKLRPFLAPVRIRSSRTILERAEMEAPLYTTTTTLPVPTTTTVPVVTTTTSV